MQRALLQVASSISFHFTPRTPTVLGTPLKVPIDKPPRHRAALRTGARSPLPNRR